MTKHLRFLFVMLLAMIWSAGWAQTTVFHETFDKCSSTGGNDGAWAATSGGNKEIKAQWKFSGDKHKSLQVDTERTFHQRYPLVML